MLCITRHTNLLEIIMYKPLPPYLTIKQSGIHGLGLFATDRIPKGTNMGITHIKHYDFENGYIRTPLGGFFNHSETPNVKAETSGDYIYLIALRDIEPDEELVATYWLYEIKV